MSFLDRIGRMFETDEERERREQASAQMKTDHIERDAARREAQESGLLGSHVTQETLYEDNRGRRGRMIPTEEFDERAEPSAVSRALASVPVPEADSASEQALTALEGYGDTVLMGTRDRVVSSLPGQPSRSEVQADAAERTLRNPVSYYSGVGTGVLASLLGGAGAGVGAAGRAGGMGIGTGRAILDPVGQLARGASALRSGARVAAPAATATSAAARAATPASTAARAAAPAAAPAAQQAPRAQQAASRVADIPGALTAQGTRNIRGAARTVRSRVPGAPTQRGSAPIDARATREILSPLMTRVSDDIGNVATRPAQTQQINMLDRLGTQPGGVNARSFATRVTSPIGNVATQPAATRTQVQRSAEYLQGVPTRRLGNPTRVTSPIGNVATQPFATRVVPGTQVGLPPGSLAGGRTLATGRPPMPSAPTSAGSASMPGARTQLQPPPGSLGGGRTLVGSPPGSLSGGRTLVGNPPGSLQGGRTLVQQQPITPMRHALQQASGAVGRRARSAGQSLGQGARTAAGAIPAYARAAVPAAVGVGSRFAAESAITGANVGESNFLSEGYFEDAAQTLADPFTQGIGATFAALAGRRAGRAARAAQRTGNPLARQTDIARSQAANREAADFLRAAGAKDSQIQSLTDPLREGDSVASRIYERLSETDPGLVRILQTRGNLRRNLDSAARGAADTTQDTLRSAPAAATEALNRASRLDVDSLPAAFESFAVRQDLPNLTELDQRSLREAVQQLRSLGQPRNYGELRRVINQLADQGNQFAKGGQIQPADVPAVRGAGLAADFLRDVEQRILRETMGDELAQSLNASRQRTMDLITLAPLARQQDSQSLTLLGAKFLLFGLTGGAAMGFGGDLTREAFGEETAEAVDSTVTWLAVLALMGASSQSAQGRRALSRLRTQWEQAHPQVYRALERTQQDTSGDPLERASRNANSAELAVRLSLQREIQGLTEETPLLDELGRQIEDTEGGYIDYFATEDNMGEDEEAYFDYDWDQ